MKNVNHDLWLNKLRWKTAYKEFLGIKSLQMDCYFYEFPDEGLKQEEQEKLIEFMGDSERLNSLRAVDFCNMFLENQIDFSIQFRYCKRRGIKHNFYCFQIVRKINKQLNRIRASCQTQSQ